MGEVRSKLLAICPEEDAGTLGSKPPLPPHKSIRNNP